ncbi:uncharacterized protein LOC136083049 [Hydra vulgaris]|uniref:Uncharacterized protein LOC136083049 n=1 Tax=Hydra vulgaris TaxID=6087 RepID=A0ABM4CA43_HYDVU
MVCDAAKSVSIAINFFGTVQRIFTFFTASTVRWDILQSVCKMTVKSLSDTRWESRINSIKVVKDNLVQIIEALYKVADSSSIGVAVSEANGLANEKSSYQFILSLTIWHDLLFEINKVETTKIFLESFRSDESFEAIIKKSEEIAIKLGTEPVLPQVRLSRKRRFFEYEGTDTPLNGKSKYKVDFFNAIIDVALVCLNERFKMLDSYNKILALSSSFIMSYFFQIHIDCCQAGFGQSDVLACN